MGELSVMGRESTRARIADVHELLQLSYRSRKGRPRVVALQAERVLSRVGLSTQEELDESLVDLASLHGQRVCAEVDPACESCPLVSFCAVGRERRSAVVCASEAPTVVDLFAGCGGLSLGFEREGFTVIVAVERDRRAAQTYRLNHPGTPVLQGDVREVTSEALVTFAGPIDDLDVVLAGPPCQGYSAAGRRDPEDPVNLLYRSVSRLGKALRARAIVLENVPGVRRVNGVGFSDRIRNSLRSAGYRAGNPRLVSADEFGVPQRRERLVYFALRSDQFPGQPFRIDPTHQPVGRDTAVRQPLPSTPRLDDVLRDMPQLGPGVEAECRTIEGRTWYNASTMKHSDPVIEKIAAIPSGGGPISYRRLEAVAARTLVAGHRALPVHPTLDRTISVREAARIQGFPDDFVFCGPRTDQPLQVANAVPPALGQAVAAGVRRVLGLSAEAVGAVAG